MRWILVAFLILFRLPMVRPVRNLWFQKDEWERELWRQSLPSFEDRGYPLGIRSDYLWGPPLRGRHLFRYTFPEMVVAYWRARRLGIRLQM